LFRSSFNTHQAVPFQTYAKSGLHLPTRLRQLNWYPFFMTTVEILFRYGAPPTEQVALALAHARDVYGIRSLALDRDAHTVRVEFDATRLTPAIVANLLASSGLQLAEELPLIPPPAPEPETAPAS
jgi:hypothetical protein